MTTNTIDPQTKVDHGVRGPKGRGGGHAGVVEPAREFITDTATAAGLWPFSTRGRHPQTGVPLGVDPHSGQLGCYDPYNAFLAGEQRASQLGVLAAHAQGKSLLTKKISTGLAGIGIPVIVPFDTKQEYTGLVDALGGTTLKVGRNGGLNLLDPGECIALAHATNAPTYVITELKARRSQLVATVAGIARNAPLKGWERSALTTALDLLPPGAAITDVPRIFTSELAAIAHSLARPLERTRTLTEPLALDVAAMATDSIGQALGTAAATQAWAINKALAVDTQNILMTEPNLTAAVIITCWTAALSAIYLTRQTNSHASQVHAIVFDEIWRATREFPALANQIGGLLRMDRNDGIISIIVTHSWTDTQQPGGSNILARCAAFALGGMQAEEINTIANAGIGLTPAELTEIRNNTTGGSANGRTGGVGRFLIKQGDHPGRLIQTTLTPTETTLYNTNQQWTTQPNQPN